MDASLLSQYSRHPQRRRSARTRQLPASCGKPLREHRIKICNEVAVHSLELADSDTVHAPPLLQAQAHRRERLRALSSPFSPSSSHVFVNRRAPLVFVESVSVGFHPGQAICSMTNRFDSELIETLNYNSSPNQRLDTFDGSFSVSVYDTAWVACVKKKGMWLFPASFRCILDRQLPQGLWHPPPYSTSDIVNGLGGLLALLSHLNDLEQSDLSLRANKAEHELRSALQTWDLSHADGVGFEVLIPSLLELVARRGVAFEFPHKYALLRLREKKLNKMSPALVYEKGGTILHSAEAFFGDDQFDFDRLAQHKIQGSIMASPAASAAYLMRSSTWDTDTEAYLERVIQEGSGRGNGGVPSAYPTNIFELSWALSTLASDSNEVESVPRSLSDRLLATLEGASVFGDKCVGFAAGVQPDLDDTAKSSLALNLLGKPGLSRAMMRMFEESHHCKTYSGERNPSFSANCNALHALVKDVAQWTDMMDVWKSKVQKLVTFLTREFLAAGGFIKDKWNHSPWYSLMLVAQTFSELLSVVTVDYRELESAFPESLTESLTQCLVRCLIITLLNQTESGSWGRLGPFEETSYCVLLLSSIGRTGLMPSAVEHITSAIATARTFLMSRPARTLPESLWIEKVNYGTSLVSISYMMAALHKTSHWESTKSIVPSSHIVKDTYLGASGSKMKTLIRRIPLLRSCSEDLVELSGLEASAYLQRLQSVRTAVFNRQGFTQDKYFAFIPLIWTTANNFRATLLSCDFLFEMMAISLLNFQADEFMESVVGELDEQALDKVVDYINVLLDSQDVEYDNGRLEFTSAIESARDTDGKTFTRSNGLTPPLIPKEVFTALERFKKHILEHPHVTNANQDDQKSLRQELRKFLLAHVQQNRDNHALQHRNGYTLSAKPANPYRERPQHRFKAWVRGTAAAHTSCAYSFAFAKCLLGSSQSSLFPTLEEQYIVDDMVLHLATMCRLYNDLGSIARDRIEGNLNCVDFEELQGDKSDASASYMSEKLLLLASHERRLLNTCMDRLSSVTSNEAWRMLQLFVTVTDMFGEIYVEKDLASRRQSNGSSPSTRAS